MLVMDRFIDVVKIVTHVHHIILGIDYTRIPLFDIFDQRNSHNAIIYTGRSNSDCDRQLAFSINCNMDFPAKPSYLVAMSISFWAPVRMFSIMDSLGFRHGSIVWIQLTGINGNMFTINNSELFRFNYQFLENILQGIRVIRKTFHKPWKGSLAGCFACYRKTAGITENRIRLETFHQCFCILNILKPLCQ